MCKKSSYESEIRFSEYSIHNISFAFVFRIMNVERKCTLQWTGSKSKTRSPQQNHLSTIAKYCHYCMVEWSNHRRSANNKFWNR